MNHPQILRLKLQRSNEVNCLYFAIFKNVLKHFKIFGTKLKQIGTSRARTMIALALEK